MEDLPAELTIDILSRLPVKTVIHCKLVCKKWRDLVLESFFVNLHLCRSPTGLIILQDPLPMPGKSRKNEPGFLKWVEIDDKIDHHHLRHEHFMSVDLFDLAPIPRKTGMYQMGSVNGLICLCQYTYPKRIRRLVDTYICNPITREYMILPKHGSHRDFWPVFYGFGVSSLTGEYKVVRIFQGKKLPNGPEAEIYTLGTGQWRSLGRVPYWVNQFSELCGLFLNNRCHWTASNKYEKIYTFDLDKEGFQLFPSPPVSAQEKQAHYKSLGVSKGCLCKLYTYDSELTFWVMKEYGIKKSWHKEVVICVDVVGWFRWETIHLSKGLKDGSILIVFEDGLGVFNPQSERIEHTFMFEPQLGGGLPYCPSFLKLKKFESESERVQMF